MQGERWHRGLGERPGSRPAVPSPAALPVSGRWAHASGAPGRGGHTSLRASSKCDAEVPRSWVSHPVPQAPCVAEGASAPWGGGDRPRCRGTPAGRRVGCCPQSPSIHHPGPLCSRDLPGGPIVPPAAQRLAATPRSSASARAGPRQGGLRCPPPQGVPSPPLPAPRSRSIPGPGGLGISWAR